MIEYLYSGMILLMLILFVTFLAIIPLYFFDNRISKNKSVVARYVAFTLSAVVIVLVVFAFSRLLVAEYTEINYTNLILKCTLPLASLCGFFLLYHNFVEQRKASIRADIANLVLIHKDNLKDIVIKVKKASGEIEEIKGRSAFVYFLNRFNDAYPAFERLWLKIMIAAIEKKNGSVLIVDDYTEITNYHEILNRSDLSQDQLDEIWSFCNSNFHYINETFIQDSRLLKRSCKENAVIHLYIRMFFDARTGEKWFDKAYDIEELNRLNNASQLGASLMDYTLPLSGSTEQSTVEILVQDLAAMLPDDFMTETIENAMDVHVYFGQYLRSLFHTYRRIDKIDDAKIKLESSRLMRSQLSSHEQAVLFLNSLTPLGNRWQIEDDLHFFEKYGIIKNIPEDLIHSIAPWDVYPVGKFKYEFKSKED